ncbi:MAG: amino acid ABC transporter permease [Bifidobacteriaceae bacterium]|jgi:putative lysine transport system permease protein|nr:amino acid ABC transporter permease [Bifidobacteriaceae bacterium]
MQPRGFFAQIWYTFTAWGPQLAKGAGITMLIAIIGTVLGLVVGLAVGVIRTIPLGKHDGGPARRALLRVVNVILAVYIEVFRGTPMMVQAAVIYYGLRQALGLAMSPLQAGLLVVTINSGAYLSEIVRGGIESVDPGQDEAGRALGLTHWQIMRGVVLPQAFRNILPAVGNEFVINIKDTSVLNIISVTELFFVGKTVANMSYRFYESYLAIGVIYLVLTFVTTRLLRLLERHLAGPDSYTLATSSTMPDSVIEPGGTTMQDALRLRHANILTGSRRAAGGTQAKGRTNG